MILYHYTNPQNRLLISWTGLKAGGRGAGKGCEHMTFGKPVVWLTKQNPSPVIMQAEWDYWDGHPNRDAMLKERELTGFPFEVGAPFWPDRTAQIIADISRTGKRLMSFAAFLRKHGGREAVEEYPAPALENWFVYLGDIPPHKLSPITVAQARVGLQIQIEQSNHQCHRDLLEATRDADPDQFVDWQRPEHEAAA